MTCGAGLTMLGRGAVDFTLSGEVDTDFTSVVLLLHLDTDLTDSSTTPKTVSAVGNAQINSTLPKFGAGAALFDGTGDYLSVAYQAGMQFGTSDFTVEGWIKLDAIGNWHGIFGNGTGAGAFDFHVATAPSNALRAYGDGGTINTTSGTALVPGAWYHVAVTRSGNTYRIFLNGAIEFTATYAAIDLNATTPWKIGGDYLANPMQGRIDDLRVTIGVCRYTGAFTVPAEAYPNAVVPIVVPPPTTVPPVPHTDPYWTSVLFLSAMDLTKVNLKTSVAYTLDSASVTATDPFDGAGALACAYPPASPTSTPFATAELIPSQTIEFWVRLDSWPTYTSGARKWANLAQQPGSVAGDQDFALAISEEEIDSIWLPVLKLYTHSLNTLSYTPIERKDMSPTSGYCPLPADGQWHHVALVSYTRPTFLDLRQEVYVDGVLGITALAAGYSSSDTLEFGGLVTPPTERGQTGYFYLSSPTLTGTTFAGAIDEIRVTAARRYTGPFVVPHYAFPRS